MSGDVAPPPRRWRRALRLLGWLALGTFVLLAGAAALAQRRRAQDRAEISATASYFDRHGQKIRYRLEGQGNPGPTIVLLSGFVGALEQWEPAQRAMMNSAPVLTYDRGGYGLSDPPSAFDADAQAEELADLATLKGVKLPLVVVGYSSSALTARAFARRHPDLLGGLVLLDPTNPEQILAVSTRDVYARRVLYERVPLVTMVKRFLGLRSAAHAGTAVPTPAEERAAKILNFPSHWWAGYQEGAAMVASAKEAELDFTKLKAPITLLSVASDEGSPELKEQFRLYQHFAAVSGARFINPKGFDHSQVHGDVSFLPHIAEAIGDVVAKVRAETPAP